MCTADDSKLKVSESTDSTKDYQHIAAQTFTFHELAVATKNFRSDCLIGEGGFGCVYKGLLKSLNPSESPIEVAVKQLNREGLQVIRTHLSVFYTLHACIFVCVRMDGCAKDLPCSVCLLIHTRTH